jgi:electron transfer flavoprotein alpha subunit
MTTLVIAEHDNAALKPSTLNTIGAAAKIGGPVHVLSPDTSARQVRRRRRRSRASRR